MQKEEKTFKSFDDFTNLYQVQKTLRFELKPVGKTAELLQKNNVFKKDERIEESYQKIKPIFDDLHRKFVVESLAIERVNIKALYDFADEYAVCRTDPKKNRKILEASEQKLRKILAKNFDIIGDSWKERYNGKTYRNKDGKEKIIKLKSKGYKVLTDASILGVLAIEYPERAELFGLFDGFFTYFGGFNETRENFYKDDGTATAVVTRIVDNFKTFLENSVTFRRHLNLKADLKLMEADLGVGNVESYAKYFLQKGVEEYNKKVGELNYRMKKLRDEQGKDVKKSDYPLLKTLHDQILGERTRQTPFVTIETNEEAKKVLDELLAMSKKRFEIVRMLVRRLCDGDFESDNDSIYITNKAINTISRRWFSDGVLFEKLLPQQGRVQKEDDAPKVAYFVSFSEIKEALGKMEGDIYKERYQCVIDLGQDRYRQFFAILLNEFERAFNGEELENGEKIKGFIEAERELFALLALETNIRSVEVKRAIKGYLDAGLRIFQLAKYFSLEVKRKKSAEKPTRTSAEFYNAYDSYASDFPFAKSYDAFRNYLAKKPGDDENKIKLNFNNGSLLGGWDKNKEKEKLGILLRDEGSLYLGLLVEGHKEIFDDAVVSQDGPCYEKMEYKFFPDPKRMIPKVSFAECNRASYGLTAEIEGIRDEYRRFQEYKKADKDSWKKKFDKAKLKKLIAYYQHCLIVGGYKKEYDLKWRDPKDYDGIGEFNDEIENQNYKVSFKLISKHYVDECVEHGELYLFNIHNKDNNLKDGKEKNGAKNLHTKYWEALFSEENIEHPLFKLSGGAELFLRKGKVGELKKRNDKGGKEVLEHKRYAEDKLFFHVPILINRGGEDVGTYKHNTFVRNYLAQNNDTYVIGIDRGEKHLLYYSIINQKGEILDQKSLNAIIGVDYQQKLVECEKQRRDDRQSWEPARKIKDLKKGYVSQAVHAICELMKKYPAIVVLEDLNMRFKQVRGGVERSVYQQFEHALIDKLGYLVFKDRSPDEDGGVFHGYQLTAPFESFEKLGKQTGFLFYTQADYTSITDPLIGFRKNVYISNSTTIEKIKTYFSGPIEICWNEELGSYCFTYDQKDFGDKKRDIASKEWAVYADVPRIKRFKERGYWRSELVNPNEMLEDLFHVWGIENPHGDTAELIQSADADGRLKGKRKFDGKEREFWKSLIYIFNLILQLRNSTSQQFSKNEKGETVITGEEIDFIASPVEPFFRTAFTMNGKTHPANLEVFAERIIGDEKERIMSEYNGDANGAYNIARKGLMLIDAIKANPEKPELFISKSGWDRFTQRAL